MNSEIAVIIITALVVSVIFTAGFYVGYLFGKKERDGREP